MYKNNFSAVIKSKNKTLREMGDQIAIPFGSEYVVALKNLNSVKAQVKVSIDGQDVTDGWLVIQPNSEQNLERSIKNHNLNSGNRFKFIERTEKIENHRGIKADDGLVRVEYKFEKKYEAPVPVITNTWTYPWYYPTYPVYPNPYWPYGYTVISNTTPSILQNNQGVVIGGCYNNSVSWSHSNSGINDGLVGGGLVGMSSQMNMCCSVQSDPAPAGITVPGSESNQTFVSTYDFACEASEVIVLRLVGSFGQVKVTKPITVDFKPICAICGRVNRATNKFCNECGASLIQY